MKLTLFSQKLTPAHIEKIKTLFNKPLEEVKFLYINTAGNYKPYKSEWMIVGERKWQALFPKFQEFDLERAYRIDPNFNFKEFLSNYDYIFVSGGNVFILSYWMKKTGADQIIKELILKDKIVYGGESAGSIYTFSNLNTYATLDAPEKAPEQINEALDLVNFAVLPHWESEKFHSGLVEIDKNFKLENIQTIPITDDQALFVADDKLEII
jgi:dipeptidase E